MGGLGGSRFESFRGGHSNCLQMESADKPVQYLIQMQDCTES